MGTLLCIRSHLQAILVALAGVVQSKHLEELLSPLFAPILTTQPRAVEHSIYLAVVHISIPARLAVIRQGRYRAVPTTSSTEPHLTNSLAIPISLTTQ